MLNDMCITPETWELIFLANILFVCQKSTKYLYIFPMTLSLVRNIKKSEFQSGQTSELCGGVRLLPNCCSKVGGPYKYLFNVKLF
jgi:hypothetical protein